MPKPTKNRIEELAKKLWRKRWVSHDIAESEWARLTPEHRRVWFDIARLAIREVQRLPRWPKARKSRSVKQPKACRIDGGKVICK